MCKTCNSLNMSGSLGETSEDGTDVGARLHRNDAELVLFVDPHEESLIVVVENTSAFRPVAVETASIKETISFLEEEMIIDELLLDSGVHAVKSVELTLEVTLEGVTSLNDLSHDLVTLFVGDARSERDFGEVSADANTGGLDEGSLVLGERRALELGSVHVGDVLVADLVTVVVLNDLVEEVVEGGVGVGGTSIDTDAGVEVLATREDASLEGNSSGIALVMVLVPDVLGEVLGAERLAVGGELGEVDELLGGLEVGSALGSGGTSGSGVGSGASGFGGGLGDTLG